ncbi:hypothetical protein [Pedobacter jeongneungensis]|uniref:hypothetical protein n=1 Tax=Pedobacter jeongneungensis TaxID=947309 RepID=UPI00046974E4|nr:hypothetical protein [Pedobacter jeongneungensis]
MKGSLNILANGGHVKTLHYIQLLTEVLVSNGVTEYKNQAVNDANQQFYATPFILKNFLFDCVKVDGTNELISLSINDFWTFFPLRDGADYNNYTQIWSALVNSSMSSCEHGSPFYGYALNSYFQPFITVALPVEWTSKYVKIFIKYAYSVAIPADVLTTGSLTLYDDAEQFVDYLHKTQTIIIPPIVAPNPPVNPPLDGGET